MAKIKNNILAEFFDELRFAPRKKKTQELLEAEKLLDITENEKEYPFEFICFRITGYRPRQTQNVQFIKGDQLKQALNIFIKRLSKELSLRAEDQPEKIYTIDELAKKFSVSKKTIQRWTAKGLKGRKYIFPGDVKRTGFTESVVKNFSDSNPRLVKKASKYSRLTDREKSEIIESAKSIYKENPNLKRTQVLKKIAANATRSLESIRQTIINYEKENPSKPIFKKPAGKLNASQRRKIFKLYNQGTPPNQLAEKYHRSRNTIYRVINRCKAENIASQQVDYINSDEFIAPLASQNILSTQNLELLEFPAQLQTPLSRDTETSLFKMYNFLKYLASIELAKIKTSNPSGTRLNAIQNRLQTADKIKNIIIEANMPLVLSIAGKHLKKGTSMPELASQGNMSLIRAVEKFDYTRGFRFSTYASWAIAKDFARNIPAESKRFDKASPGTDLSNIHKDMRIPEIPAAAQIEAARRNLEKIIENNLEPREQFIIKKRFALGSANFKKEKMTLAQIGQTLQISKERVRQLELAAIQKLRHSLTEEQLRSLQQTP